MCDHHLFLIVLPNDWTHSTQIENGYRVDERRSTGDDGQTPECDRIMPVIVEHVSSSLCQLLKCAILDKYGLTDQSTWILSSDQKQYEISFISEIGTFCEELLHRLAEIGIGRIPGTRVAVLPLTYAIGYASCPSPTSRSCKFSTLPRRSVNESPKMARISSKVPSPLLLAPRQSQRRKSIRADFMQSIRSRLMVFQVVQAIRSQSSITFDFVVLVIIASVLASLGLLENSSVILVASMLISPLMGPILAIVFGLCIHDRSLWRSGVRSEFFGLFVCLTCGFFIGLVTSIFETKWGSSTSFPTPEMKARGHFARLSVGGLIAVPSGAGVALSVLGGNAGSLVGVAISASLLPPAVNSGLLLGYSLLTAALPSLFGRHSNETYVLTPSFYRSTNETCRKFLSNDYRSLYSCEMSIETFILAISSFLLTLVNIVCIVFCAWIVLRIKEVAPSGQDNEQHESETDRFFHDDMRRFRDYQKTVHDAQELTEENKSGLSNSFQNYSEGGTKRERRKQLLALASLHDLDLTNQNDLTLSNAEARDKVKQLYKTMVQFDKDAKKLDIGLQNKRPLPTLMMDVLPPKWTELFQREEEKENLNENDDDDDETHSDEVDVHRHHYNTYHHQYRQTESPRTYRAHSYSSNPSLLNSFPIRFDREEETRLHGTRFRLTKATIADDERVYI